MAELRRLSHCDGKPAMSYTYLFFKPRRLPLSPGELSEESVEPLTNLDAVKASLNSVIPSLKWLPEGWARGETQEGRWLEFNVASGGTLAMRCSLRADYRAQVQDICDALNWVAVDEKPVCFQPHRDPIGA